MNSGVVQDVIFQPDFTSAVRPNGALIEFTKMERRVLEYLARSAGRVLSRNQILDAVNDLGSDNSNRTIDFLINRLRRKLGDRARDPQFIGTRYGEGYVWLAQVAHVAPHIADAYVVVGPLRGMDLLDDRKPMAEHFTQCLLDAFRASLGPTRIAVQVPSFKLDDHARAPGARDTRGAHVF